MKQNYNYITDRYYPEFSKKHHHNSQHQHSENQPHKNLKSQEDRKLESKLKNIIGNIEKSMKEEHIISKKKNRQAQNDRDIFGKRLRSVSHKDLKVAKINKVYTQVEEDSHDISSILSKRMQRQGRSSRNTNRSINTIALPKISSKKKYEAIDGVDEKQILLGKLVLEKVEKHFNKEKEGKQKFYDRVKSEESIDTSLIQYLKHKVKKADISIKPNQM